MKFAVFSEQLIQQYAPTIEEPHIIVSIRSPGQPRALYNPPTDDGDDNPAVQALPRASKACRGVLFIDFFDIDKPVKHDKYGELRPISDRQADRIAKFVHNHIDDVELVVCQCEAGISRSAGIASGLSAVINGDNSEFHKRHYRPNIAAKVAIQKAYAKLLNTSDLPHPE